MNKPKIRRTIDHWREDEKYYSIDVLEGTTAYSLSCIGFYPVDEFAIGDYRTPMGRLISAFVHVADYIARVHELRDGDMLTYTNDEGEKTRMGVAAADSYQGDSMIIELPTVPHLKLVVVTKNKP